MFEASLKADVLKDAVSFMNTYLKEVRIKTTTEYISMSGIDPANVCMTNIVLWQPSFEEYECDNDGIIGVDLDTMAVYLKYLKGDIKLSIDKEYIVMADENITYKMRLIDPENIDDTPKEPSLNLPTTIMMAGNELLKAVQSGAKLSNEAIIKKMEGKFGVRIEGDTDEVVVSFDRDKLTLFDGDDATAVYAIEYLVALLKHFKKQDITIKFGENQPLLITSPIGVESLKKCIIAPRAHEV